jgi:hypothetical protein
MTVTVHVQPGESISHAIARAGLIAQQGEDPHEVITIPPGVHIVGSNLNRTRIINRRTTGIPFLSFGNQS